MQIGQQEHQVQVAVDKDVVDAIHVPSRPHAIGVEWRSVPAIALRATVNSVS
jgi:hypothetical protein